MRDGQTLLAEYVQKGSEPAFQELVKRYINLVHSTAARVVGGDKHLAKDVAQTVFIEFAQKARSLPSNVMLGGWLHRHTFFTASKIVRGERRRNETERQAMEMNALEQFPNDTLARLAPVLDEVVNELGSEDRIAILLRFYEQQNFRSVGEILGSTEDAARMRVSRALEKLHSMLKHRGVALSTGGLAMALTTEAVTAAPAGLAVSIAGAALAGSGGGTTLTLFKIMTITKLKLGITGAIAVTALMTTLLLQQESKSKLKISGLQQEVEELSQLRAENDRLASQVAKAKSSQSISDKQFHELIRLRGEVGGLRRQKEEFEKLWAGIGQKKHAPVGADLEKATQEPVPKESWAFAGYGTPEATVLSALWAESKGDLKAMRLASTPENQEETEWKTKGLTDDEVAASEIDFMSKVTGFRILKTDILSDEKVLVYIRADGEQPVNVVSILKKTGDDWKIDSTNKY